MSERYPLALWSHDHLRDPVDERIEKTKLVAIPAGHARERKPGFDPALCFELEGDGRQAAGGGSGALGAVARSPGR